MIKRKVIETVEEYDANDKLIRKTITETNEDDDSPSPQYVTIPYLPNLTGNPWWLNYPLEVTCGVADSLAKSSCCAKSAFESLEKTTEILTAVKPL